MKRRIAFTMAGLFFASTCMGCHQDNSRESTTTKAEETQIQELKLYNYLSSYQGLQTGWFAQILEDQLQLKLNIVTEDTDADLIVYPTQEEYLKGVEQGLLYEWTQDDLLAEHGKNILRVYGTALDSLSSLSDDKVYGIGGNLGTKVSDVADYFYTWDVRYDLYQAIHQPNVQTLDDYADVIQKLQEYEPTTESGDATFGVSGFSEWDENLVNMVAQTVSAYYGYDSMGLGFYQMDTGEFYDPTDLEGPYIQMIRYYNELYIEGLLDPDSRTQSFEQYQAKVENGQVLSSVSKYAGSALYNTEEHLKAGTAMYSVIPENGTPLAYGVITTGEKSWIGISASTDSSALCMDFLNYLFSPEGIMTCNYGPKGLTWDYDQEGFAYLTELGQTAIEDGTTLLDNGLEEFADYKKDVMMEGYPMMIFNAANLNATNPDNGETYQYLSWKNTQESEDLPDLKIQWLNQVGATTETDYVQSIDKKIAIGSSYEVPDQTETLSSQWIQITKILKEGTWDAIYGSTPEECDQLIQRMVDNLKAVDQGDAYKTCIDWCKTEAEKRYTIEKAITRQ